MNSPIPTPPPTYMIQWSEEVSCPWSSILSSTPEAAEGTLLPLVPQSLTLFQAFSAVCRIQAAITRKRRRVTDKSPHERSHWLGERVGALRLARCTYLVLLEVGDEGGTGGVAVIDLDQKVLQALLGVPRTG